MATSTFIARAVQNALTRDPRNTTAIEKILRLIENTGPRPRRWLEMQCERFGATTTAVERMLAIGLIEPIGEKRATVYGTPAQARAARRREPA